MDAFDILVLSALCFFALLFSLMAMCGFWAGRKWERSSKAGKASKAEPLGGAGGASGPSTRAAALKRRPSEVCSEVREAIDMVEIFVNPKGSAFHKRGCFHIGSAALLLHPCRHCMPIDHFVATRARANVACSGSHAED